MQLPINYVEVEKDEMEYVDGGFYLSNDDLNAIHEGKGMNIRPSWPGGLSFSVA